MAGRCTGQDNEVQFERTPPTLTDTLRSNWTHKRTTIIIETVKKVSKFRQF
jgi:hypothetical protein